MAIVSGSGSDEVLDALSAVGRELLEQRLRLGLCEGSHCESRMWSERGAKCSLEAADDA
jgi:hypothetical protein